MVYHLLVIFRVCLCRGNKGDMTNQEKTIESIVDFVNSLALVIPANLPDSTEEVISTHSMRRHLIHPMECSLYIPGVTARLINFGSFFEESIFH